MEISVVGVGYVTIPFSSGSSLGLIPPVKEELADQLVTIPFSSGSSLGLDPQGARR